MSNKQTPLTREEIRQQLCAKSASNQRLFYTDMKSYMLGFYNGYDQNTDQLRQELADAQEKYTSLVRNTNKELVDLSERINNVTIELERVRVQRDVLSTLLRSYVDYFTGTLTPDFQKDALEILSSLEK